MRFREFKVYLKESKGGTVVVMGDSIANGIAGAGGMSKDLTNPGKNTSFILTNIVKPFAASGKAKGVTVILSSGAANSSKVVTLDGVSLQSEAFGPISTQIKLLKDAGASVALVGVASDKTPPQKPTQYTKGKKWVVDYRGVNSKLESIASAAGATFLGPLEEFDPNIAKGDGIHPYNGYKALFTAGSNVAPSVSAVTTKPEVAQGASNTPAEGSFVIQVPHGRVGPEIADVQKALVALGYALPKHGVDGVRGFETSAAVKEFQEKYGLAVDGDPGPETVAKLNSVLSSQPELIAKLKNSTSADVHAKVHADDTVAPVEYNSVTKGKIGKLLDIIAKPESGGHYDIMMGGKRDPSILKMSLIELLDYQRAYKARGAETAAAGRYQFMPNTLRGVARSLGMDLNKEIFNPETQDKLAIQLLRQKGLDRWLSGKMSDDAFMDRLAQVWAGLPSPSKGGKSWYQGVGSNRAGISVAAVQNTLNDIKSA